SLSRGIDAGRILSLVRELRVQKVRNGTLRAELRCESVPQGVGEGQGVVRCGLVGLGALAPGDWPAFAEVQFDPIAVSHGFCFSTSFCRSLSILERLSCRWCK